MTREIFGSSCVSHIASKAEWQAGRCRTGFIAMFLGWKYMHIGILACWMRLHLDKNREGDALPCPIPRAARYAYKMQPHFAGTTWTSPGGCRGRQHTNSVRPLNAVNAWQISAGREPLHNAQKAPKIGVGGSKQICPVAARAESLNQVNGPVEWWCVARPGLRVAN